MQDTIFIISSEWDIGLENWFFASEERALEVAEIQYMDCFGEDFDMSFRKALEEGLVTVETLYKG